ncbi:MAG: DUF2764 family protein [Bacteroidaceae bacterium]|nr:DUF2764 family protein [Bacteroidaceae bacterium]
MGNYYYLIAGLADISLDDSKAPVTVESFRTEVYEALDAADRKVMDMLLMENDCRNLINMLRNGSLDEDAPKGLIDAARMEELIADVKAQEAPAKDIPAFMYRFVQEWQDESWREYAAFAEDRLWSLFYEYAMSAGNEFVRRWYEFNLDLNNITSAITARKYNLDIQKVIVGSNATAQALRTSGARDWGLSQELDYFDGILRLVEEDDLSQRERRTDLLRWNWLEENTFFNYFTVERLFSYMVRLSMVERWSSLDKEQGQMLFRKLIGELKEQTEVPAEFKTN